MYEQSLVQTGLSKDQAVIYEYLVTTGPAYASRIAESTGISRPLVYKVLEQLEELGLVVKKDEPGKVPLFETTHPLTLRDMVSRKNEEVQRAKTALNAVLGALVSDFTTRTGTPGIRILPGVEGVAELYEDILNEGKDIMLIRSPNDDNAPELKQLVEQQIQAQVKLGIKTRAITPLARDTPPSILAHDAERLVTRRIVDREKFLLPAEIIIYADKVALISYDRSVMTTSIENPSIRDTFVILFEYIWQAAEKEH